MFFYMVYKSGQIFLPFCHNSRVWRTDRRTDGQIECSSLDRVCIPCSAVKIYVLVALQLLHSVYNVRQKLHHFIFAITLSDLSILK